MRWKRRLTNMGWGAEEELAALRLNMTLGYVGGDEWGDDHAGALAFSPWRMNPDGYPHTASTASSASVAAVMSIDEEKKAGNAIVAAKKKEGGKQGGKDALVSLRVRDEAVDCGPALTQTPCYIQLGQGTVAWQKPAPVYVSQLILFSLD
jgi:hypothetical protein